MSRLDLSAKLHEICDHVYFQPPETVRLTYPCIIYERRTGDTVYADDLPYRFTYCYTITYIDPDPDSEVPLQIAALPMCKMDRCFTSDNLNHTVFVLYHNWKGHLMHTVFFFLRLHEIVCYAVIPAYVYFTIFCVWHFFYSEKLFASISAIMLFCRI